MLFTVIIFQSFRAILKISTPDVSFFARLLCISAIIHITVLILQKRLFSNVCRSALILRQNLRILLPKSTMVCHLFVFWLLVFSVTGFVIKILFTPILKLAFIIFIIYFIFKLCIFINMFIQKYAMFFRNVLYILFRNLSILLFCIFCHYIVNMYFYQFVTCF